MEAMNTNSIDPSQEGPRGLTSGELRLVTAKKLQSSNDFGHRCRRSDLRPPMKVDLTVVDPKVSRNLVLANVAFQDTNSHEEEKER